MKEKGTKVFRSYIQGNRFINQKLNVPTLAKYGTDLTKMAEEDKFDPIIGRQQEVENVMQILCQRRKNNPCLIGDPGVGKSVIAQGLAQAIVKDTVPLKLMGQKVFSLDMRRIYESQHLLFKVMEEVTLSHGAIILFINELDNLIENGSDTVTNIFKTALARGVLKCIGATTIGNYREYIENDPTLQGVFQKVKVSEPSVDETIEILRGSCKSFGSFHDVQYSDCALVAAARLSNQHIRDRFLPDKAIDLIDAAGSRACIRQKNVKNVAEVVVTKSDIQHVVSSWTGIPLEKLSQSETDKLLNMEKILHKRVIGQHEAVEAISRAIRRAAAGIRDPNRPLASFIFTGPTGVGKTELAKAFAAEYFGSKEAIIRLDMSEYVESSNVTRLIGSAPGYVGYKEGGQLTEAVRRLPHSLILFDEIEKAHKDIFDVLLQILEDGRLTDGKGRTVDFKNTTIVLTSNIGSSVISAGTQIGFATSIGKPIMTINDGQVKEQVDNELRKFFRPEFLNRIDEVIVFNQLDDVQLLQIAETMLKKVSQRLEEKNIFLTCTNEFKKKLLKEGNDRRYGARPMRRSIARLLEDNLADRILRRHIKEGDRVTVDLDSNGDVLVTVDLDSNGDVLVT